MKRDSAKMDCPSDEITQQIDDVHLTEKSAAAGLSGKKKIGEEGPR